MKRWMILLGCLIGSWSLWGADEGATPSPSPEPAAAPSPTPTVPEALARPVRVMVIPVREAIDSPVLYILRRGLKQAIEQKYDAVVLDMDTPGGRLDVTFEILEALEKFPGQTVTYINKDAISAGAFISAMTRDIYFAPNGVIGAAAPVSGSGQDIDKTMKEKIVSYLSARVRSLSEGKGAYRAQVISAMLDSDLELKIGDRVLKEKGKLLSLTAKEAVEKFGEPAQPLLGAGIAPSLDELLNQKFGAGKHEATRLQVTWSEELAVLLSAWKPILLGLGLLALFIEYKMQGGSGGVFAGIGLVLLAVVFLASYVAGLSGHEPVLLFALGCALVLLEVFLFPGTLIGALVGGVLMLASLVWAMADLWPSEPLQIAWNGDAFVRPLTQLGLGLIVSVVGGALLIRFLPSRWFLDRLVLATAIAGHSQGDQLAPPATEVEIVGATGLALTALMPTGHIEVGGRRFEARVRLGSVQAGEAIRVVGRSGFSLIVERTLS